MNLTQYVEDLRRELTIAAEAGGDDARRLADRLTAPLEAATRLVLLEALSAAAGEITMELAPGSVDVRLRGRDPEFVVTPPPSEQSFEDVGGSGWAATVGGQPALSGDADEASAARTTLRLPDQLKSQVDEAAAQAGLSVNAWLVRAIAAALEPGNRDRRSRNRSMSGGQQYSGWVR